MNKADGTKKLSPWWLALAGIVLLAVGIAAGFALQRNDDSDGSPDRGRQSEVAQRGEDVMPFDLDLTTHVFTPSDSGGFQDVVADDPNDQKQIKLIREHLTEEAAKFARGDFSDPASIHGDDMPGLKTLQASYRNVQVNYSELVDGARITYTVSEPKVVKALHDWFEAQMSDHGSHAQHG